MSDLQIIMLVVLAEAIIIATSCIVTVTVPQFLSRRQDRREARVAAALEQKEEYLNWDTPDY